MELKKTQALLARLYTDEPFRKAFIADPAQAAAEYKLNYAELDQLAELAVGPAKTFSFALIRKRFGQIVNHLPATRRVLRRQTWDAFRAFAGQYNPKGIGRHLDDAIAFANFLGGKQITQMDAPPWWPLILGYELPSLKALAAPYYFKLKLYRHDILQLYHNSGDPAADYTGRPQLVIWAKFSPGGRVRHRHFFPRWWPG